MTEARRRPTAATKPAVKRGYHHEDLRRALLDAAIEHLRSGDVTGLTIQALARAAGVSPGAPYHHFPDKVSIVAALATEGFARWLEQASRAVAEEPTPERQLRALARSWLRFAATHPSHYRVMFLPDVEDRSRFVELHETSGRGLGLLLAVLAGCLPGAGPEVLKARAVVAWSTLHGFASLRNAGVLGNIPSLPGIASLEKETIEQTLSAALRPPPP
jgi:AcrR family transcriptional regulator